jgi:hypothetical protein
MTLLCVVLIVLSLLVGYLLGRTASQPQPDYSSQLEAIQSAVQELTNDLCGDKTLEESIRMTHEHGATLTDEELEYEGGSLKRIEWAVGNLSTSLSNIEKALREKQDSTR